MNQKTLPVISLESEVYTLHNCVPHTEDIPVASPYIPADNLTRDQLRALRLQLMQKNRILADLKRQLIASQHTLAQLHCMVDPGVTETLHMHQQVTDTPISFMEYTLSAMRELDSCSDRMSYLVKQLQSNRLSTKSG